MKSRERREAILKRLEGTDRAVSASDLAADLKVSRQVIVGDIALLRAEGSADILSTVRGYILIKPEPLDGEVHTVACMHGLEGVERELTIMVDCGCTVLDVVVEHAQYGSISGDLMLRSREDVAEFVSRLNDRDITPLSVLTGGVHLHHVLCPSTEAFEKCRDKLRQEFMLFE